MNIADREVPEELINRTFRDIHSIKGGSGRRGIRESRW